jgi:hypothetical protein
VSTDDAFGALSDEAPPEKRVPLALPYTVSLSDPETFVVEALTLKCDCEWVIDLYWTSAGKRGVHPVTDDRGRPFRTSSTLNAKKCVIAEHVECRTR